MIPRALLVDPEWSHRPAAARVIFIDMSKIHHHGSEHRPSNNGRIGYGCAAAAKAAECVGSHRLPDARRAPEGRTPYSDDTGRIQSEGRRGRASEWEITIFPMPGRP